MRLLLMNRLFVLFIGISLAACARSAPDLPPDYWSTNPSDKIALADFEPTDARMSCVEITKEHDGLEQEMEELEAEIRSNRRQNQVAGYFLSVGLPLTLPAAGAVDHDTEEKQQLDQDQARMDKLSHLARLKSCGQHEGATENDGSGDG